MHKPFLPIDRWTQRLKKASVWRMQAERDSAIEQGTKFRRWIEETSNRAAWNTVGHLWDVLERHRDAPELSALREKALHRARPRPSFVRRPIWHYAAGAAALALIIAVSLTRVMPASKPVTYSTAVGKRQTVVLADGSRITLDSASAVTVTQFSSNTRSLVLNKGRAHFDVAHDPTRPFRVRIGDRTVTAIGTAFNVESLGSKILVTLTQGRVKVESDTADWEHDKAILLTPGEELVGRPAGATEITQIDPRIANAWQHGQIVLNDEPLNDVAEQLNRYLATPLWVDPAIAKLRISGVFNVGKIDSFVGAITSYFPVEAKSEGGHILLEQRS